MQPRSRSARAFTFGSLGISPWPACRGRLELAPRYRERSIPRIAFTAQ